MKVLRFAFSLEEAQFKSPAHRAGERSSTAQALKGRNISRVYRALTGLGRLVDYFQGRRLWLLPIAPSGLARRRFVKELFISYLNAPEIFFTSNHLRFPSTCFEHIFSIIVYDGLCANEHSDNID